MNFCAFSILISEGGLELVGDLHRPAYRGLVTSFDGSLSELYVALADDAEIKKAQCVEIGDIAFVIGTLKNFEEGLIVFAKSFVVLSKNKTGADLSVRRLSLLSANRIDLLVGLRGKAAARAPGVLSVSVDRDEGIRGSAVLSDCVTVEVPEPCAVQTGDKVFFTGGIKKGRICGEALRVMEEEQ